MDDLISRQAAIDAVERAKTAMTADGEIYCAKINAQMNIQLLPSAQPEIIRCKDCKHWREGDAYSHCQKLFNIGVLDVYDHMTAEDDYCSRAERRTDE